MEKELPIAKDTDLCNPENGGENHNDKETGAQPAELEFYKKAQKYWQTVPSTVNGMLGGLGRISSIDIQGSSTFLNDLKSVGNRCALDCGAGIGRVSKNLLLPRFAVVDMVEQDANFAKKSFDYCATDMGTTIGYPKRIGTIHNMGLQQFHPESEKYDLIWSQWVLGHLTDQDLLAFFRRAHGGLAAGGFIVLKENVTTGQVEKDDTDSSVTRPLKAYEDGLRETGFRIVKVTRQLGFPKGLYPVYMIAARPLNASTT